MEDHHNRDLRRSEISDASDLVGKNALATSPPRPEAVLVSIGFTCGHILQLSFHFLVEDLVVEPPQELG